MRPLAWIPLLALGLAFPAAALAAPEPTSREAVDAAIDRGVAWLLAEQRPDGAFGPGGGEEPLGTTLLAALALQHAGLREEGPTKEDARLARALRYVDRAGPGREARERDPGTYATALLVLVLRNRGREADRPRLERLRDLLVRTQAQNGQWGYAGQPGDSGRDGPEVGDNSNAQFALLALGALSAAGHEIPASCLARAQAWWLRAQDEGGGYGYASGGAVASAPSASMTASGIACLGVLRALAPRPEPRLDAALGRALAWLAEDFSVTKNRGPSQGGAGERQRNAGRGWLHYYLWALERACVLAEAERVGPHDWFALGTAQLLATQKKDGSWVQESPLYATCFALLFLTRAADPPRVITPRRAATPLTPGAAAPAAPAFSEPQGPPDPRATPPLALDEIVLRALAAGPRCLPDLVAALDDPDVAVRRRAFEALAALLPADVVARADVHPLARGRLALWVRRHAPSLVVEPGRSRFE